MLAYQDRVVTERDDLNVKIRALKEYLESPSSGALDSTMRGLMNRQHDQMLAYSRTLDVRIAIFKGENSNA